MDISFTNPSTPLKKMPHRALKITLLTIIYTLVGLLTVIFLVKTYLFYQKIKHGEGLSLALQFDDSFTKSAALNKSEVAAPSVDPTRLIRSGDATFGRGPLMIIEFADFACPFSAKEYSIVRELAVKYQSQATFVFRQLPLTELHPNAMDAANAALCANEQGKFWPMHDKLFQNSEHLEKADLLRYATSIGLDTSKFIICAETKKYQKKIDEDMADAAALGAVGTPTFFINGQKIEGAIPSNIFDTILNSAVQSMNTK